MMAITEWMYNGADGEFVEFTNIGNTDIDMTGWSFDDNSRVPGSFSLSAFGIVKAGESVILAEDSEAIFRGKWGGLAGIKVIGGNTHNLGRNDEINIYDANSFLVDRLTYNDQTGNGPRTLEVSGNIALADVMSDTAHNATLSFVGDAYGSWLGKNGNPGNPGLYTPVPEPATMAALGLAVAALARRRKK
jgi:predicted extracellular nuclease